MKTRNLVTPMALVLAAFAMWSGAAAQAPKSADDLLVSLLTGGKPEVAEPAKVKVEKGKVQAATAQDAANVAAAQTCKELAKDPAATGTVLIQFPSGLGYVASGLGTYSTFENRTASLRAKRNAYIMAYLQAKKNLAEFLGGLDNQSRDTLRTELLKVSLPDAEAVNLKTQGEESLRQAVQMMLRGFVVFEVKDDPATRTIFVSIATSPKTRRQVAHLAPFALSAADLREGINEVLAEVKAGVVPPVGGRIIQVRDKGETVFVGFGSSIVGKSDNQTLQTKLILDARKLAAMRAKDSLLGLMKGDEICWRGEVVEQHQQEIKQFELKKQVDPIAAGPDAVKLLDKTRESYLNLVKSSDEYRSVREGRLPPGLIDHVWVDDAKDWAFAITIFSPSLTKKVLQDAKESRVPAGAVQPAVAASKAGPVGQGPTGQVSKNKEME